MFSISIDKLKLKCVILNKVLTLINVANYSSNTFNNDPRKVLETNINIKKLLWSFLLPIRKFLYVIPHIQRHHFFLTPQWSSRRLLSDKNLLRQAECMIFIVSTSLSLYSNHYTNDAFLNASTNGLVSTQITGTVRRRNKSSPEIQTARLISYHNVYLQLRTVLCFTDLSVDYLPTCGNGNLLHPPLTREIKK